MAASGGAWKAGVFASAGSNINLSSRSQSILRRVSSLDRFTLRDAGVLQRGRVTKTGASGFNPLVEQGLIEQTGVVGPNGYIYRLTATGKRAAR